MNPFDDLPDLEDQVDAKYQKLMESKRKLAEDEHTFRRLKRQRREERARKEEEEESERGGGVFSGSAANALSERDVLAKRSGEEQLREQARNRVLELPPFIPASSFSGTRFGYYFSRGLEGLGYYLDMKRRGALVDHFVEALQKEKDVLQEPPSSSQPMPVPTSDASMSDSKVEGQEGGQKGPDIDEILDKLSRHFTDVASKAKFKKALGMLTRLVASPELRFSKRNSVQTVGVVDMVLSLDRFQEEEDSGSLLVALFEAIEENTTMGSFFEPVGVVGEEEESQARSPYDLPPSAQFKNIRFLKKVRWLVCDKLRKMDDSFLFAQTTTTLSTQLFGLLRVYHAGIPSTTTTNSSSSSSEQEEEEREAVQGLWRQVQDTILAVLGSLFLRLSFWNKQSVDMVFTKARMSRLLFEEGERREQVDTFSTKFREWTLKQDRRLTTSVARTKEVAERHPSKKPIVPRGPDGSEGK